MTRRLLSIAALVLPLLGLGALWGNTWVASQQGTLWDVPVRGYDPRDLLRGHYIRYVYDWPGLPTERVFLDHSQAKLCITGRSPIIERVTVQNYYEAGASAECAHPVRARNDTKSDIRGLESGILYVPQARASALEKQLADPKLQGVILIRVRDDGLITPVDIRFRPRQIGPDVPGGTDPALRQR